MQINMDELKDQLKSRGYKLTPQRRAILDVVVENVGKHLSSEEIYDIVRKCCPDIGLATVYRTLQLLSEHDVLSKISLDDGCVRYELNTHQDAHHHHHLICTECNKVFEVVVDLLEDLEERIETQYHFKISDHSVKFYGICEECQSK